MQIGRAVSVSIEHVWSFTGMDCPLSSKMDQYFCLKVVNEVLHNNVKMEEVEFCAQFLAVMLLVIIQMESRVNLVDWQHFVLTLPEDWASLHIMQEYIELMGLVRKPPIIKKHVQMLLPTNLSGNPNWFSRWCFCCKYRRWVGIQRQYHAMGSYAFVVVNDQIMTKNMQGLYL
jgi:hypothetical protein